MKPQFWPARCSCCYRPLFEWVQVKEGFHGLLCLEGCILKYEYHELLLTEIQARSLGRFWAWYATVEGVVLNQTVRQGPSP